jgi:hypothetical protein
MSDGRCDVSISQLHEAAGGELEWVEKFESTCSLNVGHEGEHVFNSPDDEHLRFDDTTKRFGSYRDAPPEGHPPQLVIE